MTDTDTDANTEYRRLWWHSRRGMLELDVLLVPFTEEVYRGLAPADQAGYRRLLECEDNELFSWFMQRTRPEDPELARIVDMILNRARS